MNDSLADRIGAYGNSAEHNDAVHAEFTRLTDQVPFLKKHRDFVEQNDWGFGDRAFHYMWMLILLDAARNSAPVRALEIGVYKGQVISLWALIGREMRFDIAITGISPFRGNTRPTSPVIRRLRGWFDPRFKDELRAGNLYVEDDYLARVAQIFSTFELPIERCRLIRGLSSDPEVVAPLQEERFDVIYIDGDHSFEGVRSDIRLYAPLVREQGYLVMDDASFFLPGTLEYKGRESVSKACEEIPVLGFTNVLNIGHDRIYRKQARDGAVRPDDAA